MKPRSDDPDLDVLILAPTGADAEIAAELIAGAGSQARICKSVLALCDRLEIGAGALVIAAEALDEDTTQQLIDCLGRQPPWSDIPVMLLTLAAVDSLPPPVNALIETAGNITLLERPFKAATFQSAARMVLRLRRRQYQVRDLLVSESAARARAASESERADDRERELRASEERFRLIANSIPQLAWMARPDGYRFWFNERWYDFADARLGRTGAELWEAAQDPSCAAMVSARWQDSLQTGQPFDMEMPLRARDGGYRWFLTRAVALLDANGKPKLWFGTSTDITIQRATAQALRQSEERLLLAVQTARLGLWTYGVRARTFEASDHLVGLLGRSPNSTAEQLWDAVHADDRERVRSAIESAIEKAELFEAEFRLAMDDGAERWLTARARPILENGNVAQLLGVALDITDAKLAEQRRELALDAERAARTQLERVGRMKDEFLATLSHELRTPLNAVLGWAEVLQRSGAASPDFERGIAAIARNAKLQAQLIEDLLDMSRIVSGGLKLDTEEIDLNDVVQATLDSMVPVAAARGVELNRRPAPRATFVRGDRRRLQQVVWNLLSNAVKFTPQGGRVDVAVEHDDERARIIVTDTGQGFDEDFLPFLFERFRQEDSSRTRRQGGLGIGLSIVRQLVEMHLGEVKGSSPGVGRGATFTVALPLLPVSGARQRSQPAEVEQHFTALQDARILAVDDERDARDLVAHILSEQGARVTLASNAADALHLLLNDPPHLVISDISMPGTDGFELMKRIRRLPPESGGDVPALALTAFARSEDRDMALRCGYQEHLVKPLNAAQLLSACSRLLARRASQSSAS